jgi:hypothetical protein
VLRAVKAPAGVDATSPSDYDHDVEHEEPLTTAPAGGRNGGGDPSDPADPAPQPVG